jgi:hypothetical protein
MPTVRADGSPPGSARAQPQGDATPTVLGRYRLTRRLGSGGFGTVWAARDERLERDVAVKILPRERVVGQRFEREARAAARLSHPAIVTLYEAAVDDEGAYLVSELVRGRTLGDLLEKGRLSDRDVLQVAIAIAGGLEHAHHQGVIHRDVKPSNILVAARPSSTAHPAKLTDFGVAHVVGGDSLTRTGDVVGTLAYMSPEQAEGRECGPASDLYALALVLYEALTGVNPLRNVTHPRRLGTYLPPLRRQRRDLPRQLGVALDLALRPRPGERGTLAELRDALEASIESAGEATGIVVAGWRSPTEEEPGPEWDDDHSAAGRATGPLASGTVGPLRGPPWTHRGLAAVSAAVAIGWLSVHLLTKAPLAPAALGLIAAGAVLVLPRLGWATVVGALAATSAAQGRTGGALALLLVAAVTLVPVAAGALALAILGLGSAWPAICGRICTRWWLRGALAAAGQAWLALPGALGAGNAREVVDRLIAHGRPAALAVWAVAAVIGPWIADRGPVAARTAAVVAVSAAVGSLTGSPVGAVAGALVWLGPTVIAELRRLHGRVP